MKRKIILLSIIVLLVCGCTRLDDTNISKNMNLLLSEKTNIYNVQYDGYKYYLPKGLTFLDKED